MKFYLAPLEGITGYIYRNALHDFYGTGIAKYFMPFLAPHTKRSFNAKEKNDILFKKMIDGKPTIYYISNEKNTYIVENTTRKTYVLSEKKNQEEKEEIISEYILYINSEQMYLINDF